MLRALAAILLLTVSASAEETLTIGLQESGTVQWEIETIKAQGLAEKHGIDLTIRHVADSRAGQIALLTGAVDIILSDFVWVSIQRGEGNMVTMVPHSLAVGGLMVPAESDIKAVTDLPGHTVGVAGGPVDKSWLILQAYYESLAEKPLAGDVEARFGAAPLINELLANGNIDAGLNFWQWNARLKSAGMTELVSVATMLSDLGVSEQPPLLGWTFLETTAKPDAIRHFLDASFEAKSILLTDDTAWDDLAELMGAEAYTPLFAQLRDDYRAGIVTSYDPADITPAEQTFALLAQHGGSDLVGDQTELAPGTFWQGYHK